MPRRPRKIKPTDDMVKFSVLLDAAMARELDAIAEEMRTTGPFQLPVNRTDVTRAMIRMGIDAYRQLQERLKK
jgi:hypothetical protein